MLVNFHIREVDHSVNFKRQVRYALIGQGWPIEARILRTEEQPLRLNEKGALVIDEKKSPTIELSHARISYIALLVNATIWIIIFHLLYRLIKLYARKFGSALHTDKNLVKEQSLNT